MNPVHDGYLTTLRALLVFTISSTILYTPVFVTESWDALVTDTVLGDDVHWQNAVGMLGTTVSFAAALILLWRKRWRIVEPFDHMSGAAYTLEVRTPLLRTECTQLDFNTLYKRMTRLVEPITARPLHVHSIVLVRYGAGEVTRAALDMEYYAPVAHTSCLMHRLYMSARYRLDILQDALIQKSTTKRAYITFDSRAMRDTALRNSSRPLCDRLLASTPDGDLNVRPAPNPRDILWENIDHGLLSQCIRFILSSLLLTAISFATFRILVVLYAIRFAQQSAESDFVTRQVQLLIPSLVVSFLNWSIPQLVKVFAITIERWHTRTAQETAMMIRMVLLRIMLHVLCVLAAAPTLSRIDDSLMRNIAQISRGLILSEWIVGSSLRFLDPYTMFLRYVMAPIFARDRTERDWFFTKPRVFISERYTDMLKTIVVANVFAPSAPVVFPILVLHVYTTYLIDRSLMTHYWERIDFLGPSLHAYVRVVLTFLLVIQAASTGLFAHLWSNRMQPEWLRATLILSAIVVVASTMCIMTYIYCTKGGRNVLERCCFGHSDGPLMGPGIHSPFEIKPTGARKHRHRQRVRRHASAGISNMGIQLLTLADLYKPTIEVPKTFIDSRQYIDIELQSTL